MSYTTQMDAARKGIFTEEMQRVCEYENIRKEELMDLVAKGQVTGRRRRWCGFHDHSLWYQPPRSWR